MKETITAQDLLAFEADYDARNLRAVENAVCNVGLREASVNNDALRTLTHEFSIDIPAGEITNQKQSGRCWMFAATNVFRLQVMKNLNIKNMELSQNYPLFFDKLEKANYFLESILETLEEDTSSRLIAHLLKDPMGDGGQWDMFVNLVEKYGVCPKQCMPETFTSSRTRDMDNYLTLKLREFACTLRKGHEKGKDVASLRKLKKDMMATIYRILVLCLGKPPVEFHYEYKDKDNQYHCIHSTPKQFFDDYVKMNLRDYVSIINAPTKDKPFNRSFTVKFLGNVEGGNIVRYLNLPIKDLKKLTLAQLKDNEVVWFGSDVGQFSTRTTGFLSQSAYDFENTLQTTFPMTKAERLEYGESLMTHAMVLTGVNLVKNKPTKWKVENSWGSDTGDKGFYLADDAWFDEFVYQVVINKKYLSQEQLEAYESDPIELEPWDPMGSLA